MSNKNINLDDNMCTNRKWRISWKVTPQPTTWLPSPWTQPCNLKSKWSRLIGCRAASSPPCVWADEGAAIAHFVSLTVPLIQGFLTRWAWGDASAISQPDLSCVDWIRQSRRIIKNRKAPQNCLLPNWWKWFAATSMSAGFLLDVSAGLYQLTLLPPRAGAVPPFPLMFLQIWLITSR